MIEYDKAAIIEIINPYAPAVDACEWDLFDRIYTDDVQVDLGAAAATWSRPCKLKRSFAEFHATLDNHWHTMMGRLLHVNGDEAHAFNIGNWLLVREAAEGGPLGSVWIV